MKNKKNVMIAGVGGASLGTEIAKSLNLTNDYNIFGCDISKTAYGLGDNIFTKTWLISQGSYINNVLDACLESGASFLIPGGEQPMILLGTADALFKKSNINLLTNSTDVVSLCSDKNKTFKLLKKAGVETPRTVKIRNENDINYVGLPCIIKPSTGSGGSASVFFAVSKEEALVYAELISRNGSDPVAQEYIDEREGEFTIGVLSLPNGQIAGSIALRRVFDAKLSVAYKGRGGLISSGYSQGHIDEYADICRQAEKIAEIIKSGGPINIQGRVRNGVLLPFEINPRFSASTYLRALAGFNEVDLLINNIMGTPRPEKIKIKSGWYLRSLTEKYVLDEA